VKWKETKSTVQNNNPRSSIQQGFSCYKSAADDDQLSKFSIQLTSGRRYYIPYSYQPVFEYNPDEGLTLLTTQFKVSIVGRGLDVLLNPFSEDRIEWIKESNKRIDDNSEPVYIKSIAVSGPLFDT